MSGCCFKPLMQNFTGGDGTAEDITQEYTFEFMSGILTTTIYAPYNMQIDSITDVLNTPTTTIVVNGSAYTLGDSISMGDLLEITVSTASVIKLNIQYA